MAAVAVQQDEPRSARPAERPMAPEPAAPAADDDDWGAAFAEEARSRDGTPGGPDGPEPPDHQDGPVLAESPPLAPPDAAAPLPSQVDLDADDPPPAPPPRRSLSSRVAGLRPQLAVRPSKAAAWRLSLPVVVIVLGSAILATFLLGREQVVRTVPDSAAVYEQLGMPVNLRGIDFRDVRGANEIVDGVVVLVVEGRLVNITSRTVPLPRLRLAVRDRTGKEIYTWNAAPPKANLEPGEATPFRSRLASPPPDGASVEVRFFTAADASGR
ncbi:FxLYD domain-containing protein [Phreatobacter sp.]|uniref:FxLYD domain-containing protein n=1 Tax=Phreatobacter sp. TaxID=1966341 RepID=UPI003F705DC0